jgi:hypothetical protein
VLGCVVLLGAPGEGRELDWEGARWRVDARGAEVEDYLGRPSLRLVNGIVWLDDVSFRDGVVELDIAASDEMGLHGLCFRAVDDASYEHFYVRPFLSGQPDATQYTPVFNGVSGWQIYTGPRYAQPVEWTAERWVHVRLAVEGHRAEVRIDGGEPLVFPELVRSPVAGPIGLSSSGAAARFANVVVRPGADPGFSDGDGPPPVAPEPGLVERWRVSHPFPEERVDGVTHLDSGLLAVRSWQTLEVGPRGIANLARLHGIGEAGDTVFAEATLRADGRCLLPVRFGFSDRVRIFLNGTLLYAGADEWRSRDYRFLGSIGLFDTVVLPLAAGDNELLMAVSESFGGWGIVLQVPAPDGVEVVQPASEPGERR